MNLGSAHCAGYEFKSAMGKWSYVVSECGRWSFFLNANFFGSCSQPPSKTIHKYKSGLCVVNNLKHFSYSYHITKMSQQLT